jgi:hypothetical protein
MAANRTNRNAASGTVASQRHKVFFDFALWDFCSQVRAARPIVTLGPTRMVGTLATIFGRCHESKDRTLDLSRVRWWACRWWAVNSIFGFVSAWLAVPESAWLDVCGADDRVRLKIT